MSHENNTIVRSDEQLNVSQRRNSRNDESKIKVTYGIYKELLSTYSPSWENMKAYKTLSIFGAFTTLVLVMSAATVITGAISDAVIAPIYDLTFSQKMGIPGAVAAVLMGVFIFFMDQYRVNHTMRSARIAGYRYGKTYLLRAGITYLLSVGILVYIMINYSHYTVTSGKSDISWFSSVFDIEYLYNAGAAQAVLMLPIVLISLTIFLGFCYLVYSVVSHRRLSKDVQSMIGLNKKLRDGYIHIV